MRERNAGAFSGARQNPRSLDIGVFGGFGVVFSLVDGCVGGGVDDQSWFSFRDPLRDRDGVANVRLGASERDQRNSARRRERRQLAAHLASRAEEEDGSAHAFNPSRSPR